MAVHRSVHPGHGPRLPAAGTPPRRPASVRRTTTHSALRPHGLKGDVQILAAGRDLRTQADGEAVVVDHATLAVDIAYAKGRHITRLVTDPVEPALEDLVGNSIAAGYRSTVRAALPELLERGAVLYQLLDDIPNVLLVSGYALQVGLSDDELLAIRPESASAARRDICAGWASDGSLVKSVLEGGRLPRLLGPQAPEVRPAEDPLGWHDFDDLPPACTRRYRRIDCWREVDGIEVEAYFRDAHRDAEGFEEVIHEYTVTAEIDATTLCFIWIRANTGALPYFECPGALASADRLAGQPIADLRASVQREFKGPSTCTHLNDTLRALEDVPALIAALEG